MAIGFSRRSRRLSAALALAVAAWTGASARAGTLFWDAVPDSSSSNTLGGAGTWDTGTANWNTSATGGDATLVSWTSAGGQDIANIQPTGTDGNITVSSTVSTNEIIFDSMTNRVVSGGTINLTGAAKLTLNNGPGNGNVFISTPFTGSNGLTKAGPGILTLQSTSTFAGDTIIQQSQLRVGVNNALPITTIVEVQAGGSFCINGGVSQQIAGLRGAANTTTASGATARSLILSAASGTVTYTGQITTAGGSGGSINVTKSGNYTQVLGGTGANDMPGNWAVQGGVLALAKTAGVDAIPNTAITVTGGSLRLDASNQINNAATMTLGGGTFNSNGFSETLSTLALQSSSTLDLGAGASILNFANSSSLSWTGTLRVLNWSGLAAGGGTDQLFIGTDQSGLTLGQEAQVRFINPAGFPTAPYLSQQLASGEVVPLIPEPASMALVLASGITFMARRRRV